MKDRTVATRTTAHHTVTVMDVDGVRIMKFERVRQSSMLLSDPYETDFEYLAYFHLTLAVTPAARRTLMIGLGGGMAVKRFWRDYPDMHLDVVELDPGVVEIAREFFGLPDDERIDVVVEDGRRFLELSADTYDVIIVDAFDDERVPRPFVTEEFMREARDHLSDGGVVAYNYIGAYSGDRSRAFRSLHRTAANVWRHVWTFAVRMEGNRLRGSNDNLLLMATDAGLTTDVLLERIADRVGGLVTVAGFETFGQDLVTDPIRTGDVPILADPPAPRRVRRR